MEHNKVKRFLRSRLMKEDAEYGSSVINIDREVAHDIILNNVKEKKREKVYKSVGELEQEGTVFTHLDPEEERDILWRIGEAAIEDLLIAASGNK